MQIANYHRERRMELSNGHSNQSIPFRLRHNLFIIHTWYVVYVPGWASLIQRLRGGKFIHSYGINIFCINFFLLFIFMYGSSIEMRFGFLIPRGYYPGTVIGVRGIWNTLLNDVHVQLTWTSHVYLLLYIYVYLYLINSVSLERRGRGSRYDL